MLDETVDVIIPWNVVNDTCDPRRTKDFLSLSSRVKLIKSPHTKSISIVNTSPISTSNGVCIKIQVCFNCDKNQIKKSINNEKIAEIKNMFISVAANKTHPRAPKIILHD